MPGGAAARAARAPHAALATMSRQAEIDRAALKRRREDDDEGGGGGDNEDEEGSDDEGNDDDDDEGEDNGEDEDDDDDDEGDEDDVVHLDSSSDDDAPPERAAPTASIGAAVGMQAPMAKPTTASSATTKPSSKLTQTTIFGASAPSPSKLAPLRPSSKAGEALPAQAHSYFQSKGLDMSTAVFSGDVRTLFGAAEREDKTPCYLCNEWLDLRVNRVARMYQHLDGAKHAKVGRYLSRVVFFTCAVCDMCTP